MKPDKDMNACIRPVKPVTSAVVFLLLTFSASAQEAVPAGMEISKPVQLPPVLWDPTFYIWLLLGIIIVAAVLTLSRTVNVLTALLQAPSAKTGSEEKPEAASVSTDNAWMRFMRSMTRSVPVEKERDIMLDHDYDGIRELDNQLPPWWKIGFYLTILFAVVYLFSYHLSGNGKLQKEEYDEQMSEAARQKEEMMKHNAEFVTAENVTVCTDKAMLEEGKSIFLSNCAACHRPDAGGNVGPNLTDDYWLHGGGLQNLFRVITEGVQGKGMISWKSQLSAKKIREVASYVLSLHGSNPADAKEPQGDLWKESTVAADSSAVPADSVKAVKS